VKEESRIHEALDMAQEMKNNLNSRMQHTGSPYNRYAISPISGRDQSEVLTSSEHHQYIPAD